MPKGGHYFQVEQKFCSLTVVNGPFSFMPKGGHYCHYCHYFQVEQKFCSLTVVNGQLKMFSK